MKKIACMLLMSVLFALFARPVWAEETDPKDLPWDKAYLNLGAYFVDVDTGVRIGLNNLGAGIELDMEEFLGLSSNTAAFRVDAGYRFGRSRKHVVDFSWFRLRRDGSKTTTEQIELPPELGGPIPPNTGVNSVFNFDIFRLGYKYSLLLDERIDLKLGAGLFIMPIEVGLARTGGPLPRKEITAPLPTIAVGIDVALSRKWFLRQALELFYLQINNYEGTISNSRLAVEYYAWKHVALGLGLEGTTIDIEVTEDTNVPGLDEFIGSIGFQYYGAQFYVKLYY